MATTAGSTCGSSELSRADIFELRAFSRIAARGRYEHRFRLDDTEVLIAVSASESESPALVEERLQRGLRWLFAHLEDVLGYCAAELLETKNGDWLDEGEAPLTAPQFKRRLRLKEIDLAAAGGLTLSFLDRGLFWGHLVVVEINPDLTFRHATLAG